MSDYRNDGGEGAGPEGYENPADYVEDEEPDPAEEVWENAPPYDGPSAGPTPAAATERWRQERGAEQRAKGCGGKPEEYRGPCEAGARGQQYPMGDEPVRYNAPSTGRTGPQVTVGR